jgi:hypothetical protein
LIPKFTVSFTGEQEQNKFPQRVFTFLMAALSPWQELVKERDVIAREATLAFSLLSFSLSSS